MDVIIGGTFDIVHKGHKKLIDKAFEKASEKGSVFIGLSTGILVNKKRDVRPFEERKMKLVEYIKSKCFKADFKIEPIKDIYGPTLEEDFDSIIVSPETYTNATKINQKRSEKDKKPMEIIKIPYILADDKKPISTTRIKKGEIDSEGKLISRE